MEKLSPPPPTTKTMASLRKKPYYNTPYVLCKSVLLLPIEANGSYFLLFWGICKSTIVQNHSPVPSLTLSLGRLWLSETLDKRGTRPKAKGCRRS